MKFRSAVAILIVAIFAVGTVFAGAPEGAKLFATKCAGCHAKDASGNTPMGTKLKIKDLRGADVQNLKDDALTAKIADAKNKSHGMNAKLSKEDVANLVTYLRSIKK